MHEHEHNIESKTTTQEGRYYELTDEAPIDGVTVDTADGTVRFHTTHNCDGDLKRATRHLVSIVRDRQLGYRESELHMHPETALQMALDALEARGNNTDELVFPDDKEILNLE